MGANTSKNKTGIIDYSRSEVALVNFRDVLDIGNFSPSKHRDVTQKPDFRRTAEPTIRKGITFFSSMDVGNPGDHLRVAKFVNHTADLINVALSQRAKHVIPQCARNPDVAHAKRPFALEAFRKFATDSEPIRSRLGGRSSTLLAGP